MMAGAAERVRLPVEWWAPSVAGVAVVSFAALVVGTVLISGGEFAGFMWLAFVVALSVFAIVMAFGVLLLDLVIAALRDGALPTGTVAFASAAGASLVPLLVVGLAGKTLSFGALLAITAISPVAWRLLVSRPSES